MEKVIVQLHMSAKEREVFKKAAKCEGMAASAWMRFVLRKASEESLRKIGQRVSFVAEPVNQEAI